MKRNEIEQLLPSIFRRTVSAGSPLLAILNVMEALHAPSEEILDNRPTFLDPYQAPEQLVPYLAHWVDVGRFLTEAPALEGQDSESLSIVSSPYPPGLGRLRELIGNAISLWQWRGTRRGLLALLEIATGVQGFELVENPPDANGQPRSFHILVRAPTQAKPYQRLIRQLLEMEKPAYVTYTLQFPT